MPRKSRLIPFWVMPGSWGLSGKTKQRAEAEYYFDGYELDTEIATIDNDDEFDLKKAQAAVELKHKKITESEYDIALAEIEYEIEETPENMQAIIEAKFAGEVITEKEHDYGIAELRDDEGTWLGVKHKHGELTDREFCKSMANLREEPWVDFIEIEIDEKTGVLKSFELDWNAKFIEVIKAEGHVAPTDEGCVDLWLTQTSRNIALEELHGTGLFDDDSEESYQLKKKRLDDGNTEYK